MLETNNDASTTRETHENLHEAIQFIQSISEHLRDLMEKVEGANPERERALDETKDYPPTLRSVLIDGPDSIRRYVDDAHKMIEELQIILFDV